MTTAPAAQASREPVARLEARDGGLTLLVHGIPVQHAADTAPSEASATTRLVESINLAATGQRFVEKGVQALGPARDDAYVWAILFDDTERQPEFQFTESAPRHRFAQVSVQWNAHLFVKVASNSRDDPYATRNLLVPEQRADTERAARDPITHRLKTDPQTFDDVAAGRKTFEIRKWDRDYRVGDRLQLLRTASTGAEMAAGAPLVYTGEACDVQVLHMLDGYGLQPGWVILSIERLRRDATAWQCQPPKSTSWGPATTKAIARELHAEGFAVRALEVVAHDPLAFPPPRRGAHARS